MNEAMPLVYLPAAEAFLLWGEEQLRAGQHAPGAGAPGALSAGEPLSVELVTPQGRAPISGHALPLLEALPALAATTPATMTRGQVAISGRQRQRSPSGASRLRTRR